MMDHTLLPFLVLLPLCGACQSTAAEEIPPAPEDFAPAQASSQHEWLQQLHGLWVAQGIEGAPGEMTMEGKPIGNLWVVLEGRAEFEGTLMESRLTLGFDPAKGHFVGTWIDAMQTTLWSYTGELDLPTNTLTLAAEGPSVMGDGTTAQYRDSIEVIDANHWRMRSRIQAEDGNWTEYMVMELMRKQ